jgi:hypothetical protein
VAPETFGDGVREECSRRVSKGSAARTYCRSGPGRSSCSGRKREGWTESGMAGVPSQREGTGRDGGRKREGRGSLAMGGNGPGQREKVGWPGFPRNGRERARKKKEKAGWPGSLAMGRNGPGRKGESGMAGVPSQWEGRGQAGRERDVSKVGSRVGVGGWSGSGTGSGMRIGIGIGMSSADSARSFCCLGRAMVGLRAVGDSRLARWGSSAERGVPILSGGRNTGSVADSVDAVKAVGSALIFCTDSEKERNFSATRSVS